MKIKATLKMVGKTYAGEGKDVESAVSSIKPPFAKGAGILTLTKGNTVRERVLRPSVVNSVFGERSPTFRNIAMRNIITLFSELDAKS